MENKQCAVTKDLVPLYCEDALREESRQFVEDHLTSCEVCTQYKSEYINNKKNEINQKSNESLRIIKIASRLRSRRRKVIIGVITLFLFVIILFTQILQFSAIAGESMEPTFSSGQNLIINRIAYLFCAPKRGDIVGVNHNGNNSVKRIVGLPNEIVEIKNHQLYINGNLIKENYIEAYIGNAGDVLYPITLGDNEYFILGDNLDYSLDSRYQEVGFVSINEIWGKVLGKSISFINQKSVVHQEKLEIE